MSITIRTNNQARPLLYWDELTTSEQEQFDWISPADTDNFTFFRYKRYCYMTDYFTYIDKNNPFYPLGWYGIQLESAFSGILIKYTPCGDDVICATYYS